MPKMLGDGCQGAEGALTDGSAWGATPAGKDCCSLVSWHRFAEPGKRQG